MKRRDAQLIGEIRQYIDENLYDNHSIQTLCRQFTINREKLQLGFNELVKSTVHAYIIRERLERAAKRLIETEESIKAIAIESGYKKQRSFNNNIMSYSDEPAELTTLVDGSVRVRFYNQSILLKPDQQSDLGTDHKLNVNPNIDVQSVIAWKDGYFSFDHADLKTFLRQLGRWYNIEIEYQGQVEDQEFQGQGRIQRSLGLAIILKELETEHVHFKLDGQKLIVTP
jgi:AraC-like DNA-binding protein